MCLHRTCSRWPLYSSAPKVHTHTHTHIHTHTHTHTHTTTHTHTHPTTPTHTHTHTHTNTHTILNLAPSNRAEAKFVFPFMRCVFVRQAKASKRGVCVCVGVCVFAGQYVW